MSNSIDFESKLRDLTQRQCEILYWVCQGLTFKEVAQKIGYGEDMVTAEMSRMYDLFGLKKERRTVKRRILEQTICPIHLQRVSDPEVDCRERVIEVNAPPPDPETIREVREDVQGGLIPLKGAMTRVNPPPPPPGPEPDPGTGGMPPRPPYPRIGPPTPKGGDRIKDILIGVLVMLLLLTVCGITAAFTVGREPILRLLQPTSAPVIQTVIVTQPPSVNTPEATPVTATQVTSSTPPILDVTEKVPSDIPGMPLELGTQVSSVVARSTKPLDVYSVSLKAGKLLLIEFSSDGCVFILIYNPGSTSIAARQYSTATGFTDSCGKGWKGTFMPAISGTYYIAVEQRGIDPYTLRVFQQE